MENIDIHKLKENTANPRTITDDKFTRLITSILSFPRMLSLRPIVSTDDNIVLGGNMRTKALFSIAQMDENEIAERLSKGSKFDKLNKKEKESIIQYWSQWLDNTVVPVIYASKLTPEEQQRFIIEDNVSFGQWDWDALANEWDSSELNEWGLDVWETKDIDIDHFFKDAENEKGKEQKPVICPHCGKDIYAPLNTEKE